eukprot:TRINITY_DN396_c1_g1_i2.p1 TRINITY_DN396_c1_g1~~TRINITY_DN396_c1_g1_i2.p1  ORF type:complete len:251 (-),score=-14.32 TRINITY_DN396_c1_g1_i2:134-886(-)
MSSLMSMQGYMRNLAVWMMCFNDLLPNIMLLVKAKSKMQTSLLLQQTVLLMRIQRIRGKSQYGGLVFSLDQVCVYRFEINNGRTQTINETSFRSANQCSIYPQTSTSQLNYYQIAKHQVSYPHKRQNGQNLTCMVEIANLILCWIETIRRDHIRNIKSFWYIQQRQTIRQKSWNFYTQWNKRVEYKEADSNKQMFSMTRIYGPVPCEGTTNEPTPNYQDNYLITGMQFCLGRARFCICRFQIRDKMFFFS